MSDSRLRRTAIAFLLSLAVLGGDAAPLIAAGRQADAGADNASSGGTSIAEKIACAYLLVGGAIMLYYGPRERENGRLTMDGKSEAVAGAASIGLSFALLHDVIKRASHRSHP